MNDITLTLTTAEVNSILQVLGQLPTTIGAGLTYTVSTVSRPGYRVYTFTAGTGTITI